ncbi:hypothetical protein E0K93_19765 [Puniceibacterium sp. HSS470]|nr:hypothetical protein E0K93_19765 [Puniceibacterium sp. HSS470]
MKIFQLAAWFGLAIVIFSAPFGRSESYIEFVSIFYLVIAGLVLASSIMSTRRGGIDYLISFFYLFFLAYPGLVQVSFGIFPWGASLSYSDLALAYGIIALSQAAYLSGTGFYLMQRRQKLRVRSSLGNDFDLDSCVFYARWAVGFAIFALLLAVMVGPGQLFRARFEGGGEGGGLKTQFLFIGRSLSLLAMVIFLSLARYAPSMMIKRFTIWSAILYTPIFLMLNFPPALPRFLLFGNAIALSCIYIDFLKPKVKFLMTFAAVSILFVVFPAAKVIARPDASFQDIVNIFRIRDIVPKLLTGEFDGFMQIASTVQYLATEPIRWGMNLLGAFLFFVPRALWPSKPVHSGVIVSEELGYLYNNVANPLPSEALLAFSLPGVLILFVLLGFWISHVETNGSAILSSERGFHNFFLYAILMGFIIIIFRGALNAVAPQALTGILAYWVMMLAKRWKVTWKTRT